MPLRKFRSVEEMDEQRRELWCDEPEAEYFKRVGELWDLSSRINPRRFPRGVFKYRNLEEAQADRDRLLTEHVRQLWRSRIENGTMRIVQNGRRHDA